MLAGQNVGQMLSQVPQVDTLVRIVEWVAVLGFELAWHVGFSIATIVLPSL